MRTGSALTLLALMISGCGKEEVAPTAGPSAETPPALNLPLIVYATMPASRLQPVLDAYTAETGKKVQLVTGDRDIASPSDAGQGSLPAADLLLVRSLSELWPFAEKNGFRPTFSASIEVNIPQDLRDPESRWTALGTHGRIVVYNTERVSVDALGDVDDYAALGDNAWRDKLCLSSSQLPGNRTLVAFLIRQYDLRDAEIVVRKWLANLATNVFADDRSLMDAVADGQCAIGITGSHELARYLSANAAAPIALHFFADSGSVAVDASGGGVTRHARNPRDAAELLSWLTTNAPNALYAAQNQEFPANAVAPLSRSIEAWRDLVSAPTSLSALGFLHEDTILLNKRARYP